MANRSSDKKPLVSPSSFSPTADIPSTNTVFEDDDDVSVTTEVSLQPSPGSLTIFGIKIPLQLFNGLLAGITVVTNVGLVVTLTLYAKSLDQKSDIYSILMFNAVLFPIILFAIALIQKSTVEKDMILVPWKQWKIISYTGVLNAFNALLVIYTSDPSRTPAYLQAILMTTTIPYTVVCRYIMLKQGIENYFLKE